jgi:hypothetical protein
MSFAYRPGFGLGVGGDMGGADIRKGVTGFDYFTCTEPLGSTRGFLKDIERLFTPPNIRELELMPNI